MTLHDLLATGLTPREDSGLKLDLDDVWDEILDMQEAPTVEVPYEELLREIGRSVVGK